MTRWLEYFSIFGHLQKANLPNSIKIAEFCKVHFFVKSKIGKPAIFFENFPKSGHFWLTIQWRNSVNFGSYKAKEFIFYHFQGVYVKPLLMALALMLFQQFSGINAVLFYLQEIFTATGNELEPVGISAFIICLVQVKRSFGNNWKSSIIG